MLQRLCCRYATPGWSGSQISAVLLAGLSNGMVAVDALAFQQMLVAHQTRMQAVAKAAGMQQPVQQQQQQQLQQAAPMAVFKAPGGGGDVLNPAGFLYMPQVSAD